MDYGLNQCAQVRGNNTIADVVDVAAIKKEILRLRGLVQDVREVEIMDGGQQVSHNASQFGIAHLVSVFGPGWDDVGVVFELALVSRELAVGKQVGLQAMQENSPVRRAVRVGVGDRRCVVRP